MNNYYREFIRGFALATNLDYPAAEAQWGAWSRQLTDGDRSAIEAQGQDSGFSEGQNFANFFKTNPDAV